MAILKTILRGESFTICFVLPADYDLTHIQQIKVYIGSLHFAHVIAGRLVVVQLKSEQTALLGASNDIVFTLKDSVHGMMKDVLGSLEVVKTYASVNDTSVNQENDVVITLSITDNIIEVGHVLYDVFRVESAYELAVEGGYTGTEEQFNTDLAMVGDIVPFLERAEQAAEDAETAQGLSEAAKNLSVVAKDSAETAAGAATTKAGEASDSAIASEAARLLSVAAQELSEQAKDDSVAAKLLSEAAKDLAIAAELATSQDAEQTALDQIATAADRLQTGLDKIAAAGYASDALIHKNAAYQAETNSEGWAEASEAAKVLSIVAQGLSEAARDKAQKWAEENEDVPVEVGKFSAKHWSAKSLANYAKLPETERALSDIIAHLLGRIETLEQFFATGKYAAIETNSLSAVEYIKFKGADLFLFGTSAPAVTPDFVGQFFVNTTAGVTYQSKGITNSGDWKQTSN